MSACARVEALLLCLALAVPAAGRAAPCPARTLAQAGPGGLGGDAPSQRILAFELPRAGRVWAEAEGLAGLEGEDRDAAPEVFLDDTYLGPLLPEQGASWRSPLAVPLPAGPHQLLLRDAQPGGLGPSLRWRRLRILAEGDCPPRRRPRRVKARASAAPSPVRRAAAAPTETLRTDCGPVAESSAWPVRLAGRELALAPSGDRPADSGVLARLRIGQAWSARLKIPSDADAQPYPLVARLDPDGPEGMRFLVLADRDLPGRVSVKAVGYRPDAWEPLTIWLCPGRLVVRFAQEADMEVPYPFPRADLRLGALGLSLDLAPAQDAAR